MVNVNIWFTARSRSTALMRCLSNIPETKILFEKFLWTYIAEHNPDIVEGFGVEVDPNVNYDSILKEYKECTAKYKIIKDLILGVKPEDIPDIITKDSVNIFLIRDPALVATSFLPNSGNTYYDILEANPVFTMDSFFGRMLETITYVEQNCTKPPLVLPGYVLSSKEKSIEAVKKICELMEVPFSEDILTWESLETFDPTWDVPKLAIAGDIIFGFFMRANKSTCFEDSRERKVDLDSYAEENPAMVAEVKDAKAKYEACLKFATDF